MTCCCKIFISNIKMAFGYECLEIPNTVKKKKKTEGLQFFNNQITSFCPICSHKTLNTVSAICNQLKRFENILNFYLRTKYQNNGSFSSYSCMLAYSMPEMKTQCSKP